MNEAAKGTEVGSTSGWAVLFSASSTGTTQKPNPDAAKKRLEEVVQDALKTLDEAPEQR